MLLRCSGGTTAPVTSSLSRPARTERVVNVGRSVTFGFSGINQRQHGAQLFGFLQEGIMAEQRGYLVQPGIGQARGQRAHVAMGTSWSSRTATTSVRTATRVASTWCRSMDSDRQMKDSGR